MAGGPWENVSSLTLAHRPCPDRGLAGPPQSTKGGRRKGQAAACRNEGRDGKARGRGGPDGP